MKIIDGESGVPVMTNKRDLKRWEVLMVHDVAKEKPKLVGALQLSKRKYPKQQLDAPAGSNQRKCEVLRTAVLRMGVNCSWMFACRVCKRYMHDTQTGPSM